MTEDISISGLYYRYGRTSDEQIRDFLGRLKIVILGNKGIGTIQGYYPLSEGFLGRILENPRGVSITFDSPETGEDYEDRLEKYKTVKYLVKSSSRFFLKPDIGEVFDQIPLTDLLSSKLSAIEIVSDVCELLPDTEGEHFIMVVNLLMEKERYGNSN
jgi:hypothetical protein